jgi:hypothetical protein
MNPFWTRLLFAGMLVVVPSHLASAQTVPPGATPAGAAPAGGARFFTGHLEWTPKVNLPEAGLDSNVFGSATNPQDDWFAIFQPQVDARLPLGVADIAMQGGIDVVHFQRFTSERAVNRRFNSRATFLQTRFQPFAGVNLSVVKDRPNREFDQRARRSLREFTAGVVTGLTPRAKLELSAVRRSTLFNPGEQYRGIDLASQLNVVSNGGNAAIGIEITPFTSLLVGAGATRDEFTLRDSRVDNLRGDIGVEFAPDAVIRGRAMFGYHRLTPSGAESSTGFSGWESTVALSYTLRRRTRFDAQLNRGTNYSSLESRLFYVTTGGSIDIVHTLVGPLDLVLGGSLDQFAYAATPLLPSKLDRYDVVRGGVSVRVGTSMRIGMNYAQDRRRTPDARESFERHRVFTSISYGL